MGGVGRCWGWSIGAWRRVLGEMSEYLIGKGVVKKKVKEAEGNTERML
jgi:hypothetical protein